MVNRTTSNSTNPYCGIEAGEPKSMLSGLTKQTAELIKECLTLASALQIKANELGRAPINDSKSPPWCGEERSEVRTLESTMRENIDSLMTLRANLEETSTHLEHLV